MNFVAHTRPPSIGFDVAMIQTQPGGTVILEKLESERRHNG
jgi:hypothetical protein